VIAHSEFLALLFFNRAVEQNAAFSNQLFRFAAATTQSAKLNELTELDRNFTDADVAWRGGSGWFVRNVFHENAL